MVAARYIHSPHSMSHIFTLCLVLLNLIRTSNISFPPDYLNSIKPWLYYMLLFELQFSPPLNMHNYIRVTLVLSCLGSLFAFPFPSEEFRVRSLLTGRALTPDNTCGNVQNGQNNGYSCDPTIENGGGCCSSSGFCG